MKREFFIVFIILLLGLILSAFLGNRLTEGMTNSAKPAETIAKKPTVDKVIAKKPTTNKAVTSLTDIKGYKISDISSNKMGSEISIKLNKTTKESFENLTEAYTNKFSSTLYDNYNHFKGDSQPNIYYGPDESTARVIDLPNDNNIVITYKNGNTEIYYIDKENSDQNIAKYYGPNDSSAKIITDSNKKKSIKITKPDGTKVVYNQDNVFSYSNQDKTINQYDSDIHTKTTDYNSAFKTPEEINKTYYASLPKGIPKCQIPDGEEDLYILKSQVVPPVCPKCPEQIVKCPNDFDASKCPPCPPCARCPEPSFTCAKVPNYKAFNQNTMPVPSLNSFSTFGM